MLRSEAENPRYTFETFVAGARSRAALEACIRAAEGEGTSPLLLHGPTGAGKTHLLHAIAARMRARNPSLEVIRVSTSRFTAEMVESIRLDQMEGFQRQLAAIDVLMLDDLQFADRMERTQEGVVHHVSGHPKLQLIFTATAPPETLPVIESMRTLLASGLVVEVGLPDVEERMELARRLALRRHVSLPDDVLRLLAECAGSAPELDGMISRLATELAIAPRELDADAARAILRGLLSR